MKKNKKIGVAIVATLGLFALVAGCLYIASAIFIALIGVDLEPSILLVIKYMQAYSDHELVMNNAKIALAIAFVLPVALFLAVILLLRKKEPLYGHAKLANQAELRKKGLLPKLSDLGNGIMIGKTNFGKMVKSAFMFFKGAQFVMVVAPTRSGKGVSFVIPNLLLYPNSAVVLDIKQENWDLTSKYRQEKLGNECFLFNPLATDYRTHRYNPLDYISEDENFRVNDVQRIAHMFYPSPKDGDDIWVSTSRSLFTGIILMLIETGEPVNLGNVLDQVSNGDGQKHLKEIMELQEAKGTPLSDSCIRALNEYVGMDSEKTRAGVVGNFRTSLQLWSNPIVRKATETSDFSFHDIRKKKISIYVGVTPNNLDILQPLLNLFFQQLINTNLEELPEQNPEIKHDVLLLMDEFTALGEIPVLMKGVAYIAGYGLRLAPIIQSVDQLRSVYGHENANNFVQNIACYIVFPPSKKDTNSAKELSEMIGYRTVKSRSVDLKKRSQGSESDHERAVFLPQEITNLGEDRSIVVIDNMNPVVASKVRYFEEDFFLDKFEEISGKRVSGLEIKDLAQEGAYALNVPLIDLGKNRSIENEEDENSIEKIDPIGEKLQGFIKSTDGILKAFRLKKILGEQPKPENSEAGIMAYIDNMIHTCLYSDSLPA